MNRPLDNCPQERIRLEAEAVRLVFRLIEIGRLKWVTSEVLAFEIDQNPNYDHRNLIRSILGWADEYVKLGAEVVSEAKRFERLGLSPMDSLHLASAKAGNTRVFLTVDDRLLRKATRFHNKIAIRVENPLNWIGDTS
ncbi:MAG: PIN domain-containing protein [Candidatus Omnitrophica bacterium]|nr:PIN domain-containing protein [Candidatus Omnitrophota bacterium]